MKKFLVGCLIFVLLLILAFFLVGLFLPSSFESERSETISASPEEIHPYLEDFHNWPSWMVWYRLDPEMKIEYSGTEKGVGAVMSWESESQGSGKLTITKSDPDTGLSMDLLLMNSIGALTDVTYAPVVGGGEATRVTWRTYGDLGKNPLMHYMAWAFDDMMGPKFETNLTNLKSLLEAE